MLRIIIIIGVIVLFDCCNNVHTVSNLEEDKRYDTLKAYNSKDFYFEANDKSLSERNFNVKRKIVNDSVFVEYGLICSSDTAEICSLKFSFNNKVWSIWDGDMWRIFYDNKKDSINTIVLKYTNRTIIPEKRIVIGNRSFASFSCPGNDVDFSTDNNSFGFSPIYGIVILENPMTYFKRSDFKLE